MFQSSSRRLSRWVSHSRFSSTAYYITIALLTMLLVRRVYESSVASETKIRTIKTSPSPVISEPPPHTPPTFRRPRPVTPKPTPVRPTEPPYFAFGSNRHASLVVVLLPPSASSSTHTSSLEYASNIVLWARAVKAASVESLLHICGTTQTPAPRIKSRIVATAFRRIISYDEFDSEENEVSEISGCLQRAVLNAKRENRGSVFIVSSYDVTLQSTTVIDALHETYSRQMKKEKEMIKMNNNSDDNGDDDASWIVAPMFVANDDSGAIVNYGYDLWRNGYDGGESGLFEPRFAGLGVHDIRVEVDHEVARPDSRLLLLSRDSLERVIMSSWLTQNNRTLTHTNAPLMVTNSKGAIVYYSDARPFPALQMPKKAASNNKTSQFIIPVKTVVCARAQVSMLNNYNNNNNNNLLLRHLTFPRDDSLARYLFIHDDDAPSSLITTWSLPCDVHRARRVGLQLASLLLYFEKFQHEAFWYGTTHAPAGGLGISDAERSFSRQAVNVLSVCPEVVEEAFAVQSNNKNKSHVFFFPSFYASALRRAWMRGRKIMNNNDNKKTVIWIDLAGNLTIQEQHKHLPIAWRVLPGEHEDEKNRAALRRATTTEFGYKRLWTVSHAQYRILVNNILKTNKKMELIETVHFGIDTDLYHLKSTHLLGYENNNNNNNNNPPLLSLNTEDFNIFVHSDDERVTYASLRDDFIFGTTTTTTIIKSFLSDLTQPLNITFVFDILCSRGNDTTTTTSMVLSKQIPINKYKNKNNTIQEYHHINVYPCVPFPNMDISPVFLKSFDVVVDVARELPTRVVLSAMSLEIPIISVSDDGDLLLPTTAFLLDNNNNDNNNNGMWSDLTEMLSVIFKGEQMVRLKVDAGRKRVVKYRDTRNILPRLVLKMSKLINEMKNEK
eukprot:PhM_4_TR4677/c0_g1_i1/m.33828